MNNAIILIAEPSLSKAEFNMLLSLVHPDKQKRIKRYRFFKDAQNVLLGDILARKEICIATRLCNKQLVFSTNEYGKPLLEESLKVHFNISHSSCYVACIIDDQPVGIDIEQIKAIDLKIADRFFTDSEKSYIHSADGSLQDHRFFEIWTKKESRIKWEGAGLSKPLTSFDVFDTSDKSAIYYHQIFETDDVICNVCSTKSQPPSLEIIDTRILIDHVNINTSMYFS